MLKGNPCAERIELSFIKVGVPLHKLDAAERAEIKRIKSMYPGTTIVVKDEPSMRVCFKRAPFRLDPAWR
jgi:hypothetical protein